MARIISQITSARVTPADLVVVFGGTNDEGWGLEIGDLFSQREVTDGFNRPCIAYEAPTQTTLFGGALHQIVTTIRSFKPHVPILFITPLKKGYGTVGTVASNCKLVSTGLMMDDYIDAIKTVANYYCIPVFDAGHMSLIDLQFDNNGNYWSQDNTHILAEGNKVLANLLYKFIINNIFITCLFICLYTKAPSPGILME